MNATMPRDHTNPEGTAEISYYNTPERYFPHSSGLICAVALRMHTRVCDAWRGGLQNNALYRISPKKVHKKDRPAMQGGLSSVYGLTSLAGK
jgi:hypothetical protein